MAGCYSYLAPERSAVVRTVAVAIADYVVFHSGQAAVVAEGKRFVNSYLVGTRLEDIRSDTHLYSSDMKRPRTAQLVEESVLWEAPGHQGTAAKR